MSDLLNGSIPSMNSTLDECAHQLDDSFQAIKLFNFSLTILLSLAGLAGNLLVLVVNYKIRAKTSTDVYITALAVSDNLLILALSPYAYRYVDQLLYPSQNDWTISGIVTLVSLLIEHIGQVMNTYIIVLLSGDRYIQVKYIVKSKSWCTPRVAQRAVTLISVLAVIFTAPRFWEYIPLVLTPETSVDKCNGYFRFTSGIGSDSQYRLIYGFIIYLIVMYFIPLIILAITNYTLISTIHGRRKWLKSIAADSKIGGKEMQKSSRVTRRKEYMAIVTLLAVTLTFMVLQVPDMTLQFIWRLKPSLGPTASIFTFQLMILNSSVNFFIYALSSDVFRTRVSTVVKCTAKEFTSSECEATTSKNSRHDTESRHETIDTV